MIRRLLTSASATSLLLCVATVAAWARGALSESEELSFGAANGRMWEVWLARDGIGALTSAAFPHPRWWNRPAFHNRPGSPAAKLQLSETPAGPVRKAAFLGFKYQDYLATPLLWHDRLGWQPATGSWQQSGVVFVVAGTQSVMLREIVLPYWMPALVTAAGSTFVLVQMSQRFRRRRRRRSARCVTCGYDLRASTDRCPECGSIIAVG